MVLLGYVQQRATTTCQLVSEAVFVLACCQLRSFKKNVQDSEPQSFQLVGTSCIHDKLNSIIGNH
eukprot:5869656-Amphidinium_carterae.1